MTTASSLAGLADLPLGAPSARACRDRLLQGHRRAWPKTSPSSSEFDARRLAPCRPVHRALADGPEARDGRAPSRSSHAAAHEVGGGDDRDGLLVMSMPSEGTPRRCRGSAFDEAGFLSVMSRTRARRRSASSRSRWRGRRRRAAPARRGSWLFMKACRRGAGGRRPRRAAPP
jgi:hypothetical protein